MFYDILKGKKAFRKGGHLHRGVKGTPAKKVLPQMLM